jgi:YD repeat-containing protein
VTKENTIANESHLSPPPFPLNALGDLETLTSPDSGVTRYDYDAGGNRISEVDGQNRTTRYAYDALDRLTRIDYPGTALDVTLVYDEAGRRNGIGRLTRLIDGSGVTTFDYDGQGRLVAQRTRRAGIQQDLAFAYDGAGRLTALTYPSGRTVEYRRDSVSGRVTGVTLVQVGGAHAGERHHLCALWAADRSDPGKRHCAGQDPRSESSGCQPDIRWRCVARLPVRLGGQHRADRRPPGCRRRPGLCRKVQKRGR